MINDFVIQGAIGFYPEKRKKNKTKLRNSKHRNHEFSKIWDAVTRGVMDGQHLGQEHQVWAAIKLAIDRAYQLGQQHQKHEIWHLGCGKHNLSKRKSICGKK